MHPWSISAMHFRALSSWRRVAIVRFVRISVDPRARSERPETDRGDVLDGREARTPAVRVWKLNGGLVRDPVIADVEVLRIARTAGIRKLQRGDRPKVNGRSWPSPPWGPSAHRTSRPFKWDLRSVAMGSI